jgi:hypothetical protein
MKDKVSSCASLCSQCKGLCYIFTLTISRSALDILQSRIGSGGKHGEGVNVERAASVARDVCPD